MAKKFELVETNEKGKLNAYVNGKFRGYVENPKRGSYSLFMAKGSVINFQSKKDLENYLVGKFGK
jgi:hypothetical protein